MSTWYGVVYPESTDERYELLSQQLSSLMDGERELLPNLANTSALLFQGLENISWAGFYLLSKGMLVLGPFQGNPACIRIPLGRGVCGTAAQTRTTTLVPDVEKFPGHIACDAQSRSEIVIPLLLGDTLLGVLDIDSPIPERFTEKDKAHLEQLCKQLVAGCDW